MDLVLFFAAVIAFAVFAYVVMDGFDLGIGILFPFLKAEEKDVAMNSIAPVWDGNETWLVMGGGGLLATFPLAYAVLLPALYIPLIVMVLGLIFRGVAFEFRWRDPGHKRFWDAGFVAGSIIAALCQGIAVGALVQGVRVEGRAYAGGALDWLTAFSTTTAIALVAGYALLGATWLVWKTEGELQERARRLARYAAAATLLAILLVSVWSPLLNTAYWQRWFSWPAIAYTLPVPLAVLGMAYLLHRGLEPGTRDVQAFLAALGLFLLSYIGLGICLYPNVVPPSITIWNSAAPESSLAFLFVGSIILLPLILGYTAYAYWVFRGKVRADEGYH